MFTNIGTSRFLIYTVFIAILSACGGGSGSDDDDDIIDGTGAGIASPGNGQRISAMNYDFDNNGTPEGLAEMTYDASGFITLIQYTYTDDGTNDTNFNTFSLNFGAEDKTIEYGYDSGGTLISITETTSTERIVSNYTWDIDGLISNSTIQFFNSADVLQNTVRFDLTYQLSNLISWNEEFELTGLPVVELGEGAITYDNNTGLPSMISRTELLGGITEDMALTFLPDGQISSIITTSPDIPNFENTVQFAYALAVNVQGAPEGNLFNRQVFPDDLADTYNWGYSYNGNLLDQQIIDMGSDIVYDAIISFEWENGACQRNFIWAPRAEPNFVAAGKEPFIPASGYVLLDYCDTRGSIM